MQGKKTITYTDLNSASNQSELPLKTLSILGVISGASIEIITPFVASDGTDFKLSVGRAGFPEAFLWADATVVGVNPTDGMGANDVWYQGDKSITTQITTGMNTDATTPFTQGEALVTIQYDEDIVDL